MKAVGRCGLKGENNNRIAYQSCMAIQNNANHPLFRVSNSLRPTAYVLFVSAEKFSQTVNSDTGSNSILIVFPNYVEFYL